MEEPFNVADKVKEQYTEEVAVNRDRWTNRRESFLVFLGFSVGIANVWRFSYLAFSYGGGAFLIPYVIFAAFIGIPLYFLEVALGQYTNKSVIEVWSLVPGFKGIGAGSFVVCFYASMYYIMVLAWSVLYLSHSFSPGDFSWSTCDNWWNTNSCIPYTSLRPTSVVDAKSTFLNESSYRNQAAMKNGSFAVTEFWQNYVLRASSSINEIGTCSNWPMVACFIIAWILVYGCCFKGAQSAGKVVYVTATFPYVILSILTVRGCTLPGAADGIYYYMVPDVAKLADAQVWVQAGSQVLYSYGVCFAALVTFGSYNDFHSNCYRTCIQIPIICSATSVFAGFSVFAVVGHLAHLQNINVTDVTSHGPGLAFQTYPTAISLMPFPQLWGILFFLMLIMLGLDSQFTCVEAIVCAINDHWPKYFRTNRRKRALTLGMCVALAILGFPMTFGNGIYLFELYNNYSVSGFSLLTLAALESIVIGYVYGTERFCSNVKEMIGYRPSVYFKYCYKFATPLLLLGILCFYALKYTRVEYAGQQYPDWADVFGWCTAMSSVCWVPILFVYAFYKARGSFKQRLRQILYPLDLKEQSKQGVQQEAEMFIITK